MRSYRVDCVARGRLAEGGTPHQTQRLSATDHLTRTRRRRLTPAPHVNLTGRDCSSHKANSYYCRDIPNAIRFSRVYTAHPDSETTLYDIQQQLEPRRIARDTSASRNNSRRVVSKPVRLPSPSHDPCDCPLHVCPLGFPRQCHIPDVVNIEPSVASTECSPPPVLPFPAQFVQCATGPNARGNYRHLTAAIDTTQHHSPHSP